MGESKGKGEGEENARVKEEERVRQDNIGEWERGRKKGSRERKGENPRIRRRTRRCKERKEWKIRKGKWMKRRKQKRGIRMRETEKKEKALEEPTVGRILDEQNLRFVAAFQGM